MSDTPHVGFIGLGVMGSRMAATLARDADDNLIRKAGIMGIVLAGDL